LGEIYRQGKGIPPGENYVEAAIWYLLAAERGNVLAQARIGEMFFNGDGVPEDFAKAYVWLNMAINNLAPGFDVLQKRLIGLRDTALSRLSREQISEAQRQSLQWHARPSTANQVAEWRPRSAVAHHGDSETLGVPSEYSHCEMQ
jgi:TPR repeat protein